MWTGVASFELRSERATVKPFMPGSIASRMDCFELVMQSKVKVVRARCGYNNPVRLFLQRVAQDSCHAWIVLDDQNSHMKVNP